MAWPPISSPGPRRPAVAKCQKIVESSLTHLHKPGMTAEALYSNYTSFGDDPFIVVPAGAPNSTFSRGSMQSSARLCRGLDFRGSETGAVPASRRMGV
jgi:hypothetical protein